MDGQMSEKHNATDQDGHTMKLYAHIHQEWINVCTTWHTACQAVSTETEAAYSNKEMRRRRMKLHTLHFIFQPVKRLLSTETQTVLKLQRLQSVYSSLRETHLRATVRHLSYGITQCYLPPDTGEHAMP